MVGDEVLRGSDDPMNVLRRLRAQAAVPRARRGSQSPGRPWSIAGRGPGDDTSNDHDVPDVRADVVVTEAGTATLRAPRIDIGHTFLTKISANIDNLALASSAAEEVDKVAWATKCGADTVIELTTKADIHTGRLVPGPLPAKLPLRPLR